MIVWGGSSSKLIQWHPHSFTTFTCYSHLNTKIFKQYKFSLTVSKTNRLKQLIRESKGSQIMFSNDTFPIRACLKLDRCACWMGTTFASIYHGGASNANTAGRLCSWRGPCFLLHAVHWPCTLFPFLCFLCHACCVANGISCSKLTFFHTLSI